MAEEASQDTGAQPDLATGSDKAIESSVPHSQIPEVNRPRLHENAALCKGILSTIQAPVPLKIKASTITSAGSGLFTTGDIDEYTEIFRSNPLVATRATGYTKVCDHCFISSDSEIHPEGRYQSSEDPKPEIRSCVGCKAARYCSKVWMNTRTSNHELRLSDVLLVMPDKGMEGLPQVRM
jgi:hypothetical protein